MQKNVKSSLLLLTLLFVLVLSISSAFAQDLDNSTNDFAVNDNEESISIESQNDGYEEVSVVNDDGCATDSISVVNDDEKLGYAESTSSAYIKFDQDDITITEGESATIKGSLVNSQGSDPGGADFPVTMYINGQFIKYVDFIGHAFTYTVEASKLPASSSPYKISFEAEDGPEYSGEYLEGSGGPEMATSWVMVTVNSNTPEPESLTEVYVDYANGADTNSGISSDAAFKTIGYALGVVEDNAIIHIADGVNYLDGADVNGLNITKNVTLIGMGNNVVIDARNAGRIFKIQAVTLSLSNLIFTNANVSSASDKRGAALWVNATTLTIDNCQFINNTAGPASSYGGAITLKASNATIRNSLFDGNTAYYTGAAVNAENGNIYLNVDNCVFTNNAVTNVASNWANGAAICAYGTVAVTNTVFYNNSGKNGKSVYKYAGDLVLSNSVLLDGNNSVYKYDAASQANLNGNWWGNNDTNKDVNPKDLGYTNADVDSYLYLNLSTSSTTLEIGKPIAIDIKFISQGATNLADVAATLSSDNGTFDEDTLTIVNGQGSVAFTSADVGVNSISVNVLGIIDTIELTFDSATYDVVYVDYADGSDSNSGASVDSSLKTIEKALTVVKNNGTIYIADGVNYLDGADVNGINIINNVSLVGMGESTVIDARNGGRIFKIQADNVSLSNLIFMNANTENDSDKRGAALWVNGTTLTIDNCQFINNTAGPASSYGGAITLKASNTTIKNSLFDGNTAYYTGAAVNAEKGNLYLNVDNCVFINNQVTNVASNWANGAGICAYGTTVVNNSVFYNNSAKNGKSVYKYAGDLILSNSIILDGNNSVFKYDAASQADLNGNWWGNNDTTKDLTPTNLTYTNADVESYLYLSLSTSATTLETTKPISIDVKLISQDAVNLPDLIASLSSDDGTFDHDEITLVNGIGNVQFTSNTVGVNTISVNVLGVSDSIELTFEEYYQKGQIVDKMVEIDRGVVSGNVDFVQVNPGATTGTLVYTIPEGMTNIKSVIVIINDYSGSGAQTYGLYSNVTLNTPNGLEVLAFDTLRMDEFPSFTGDDKVYGVNRHTTRQYSDYQQIFDITDKVSNLKSGDTINIGVTNTKISDLQFDGKIKLIGLLFAYDDGDEDNFTYWFNAGQLWTTGSETLNIDTSDYVGKDNNITIKSVACSSELAKVFKINNVNFAPTSVSSGNYYYQYIIWDNMAPMFNKGEYTSFFFTCSDQGMYTPSYKTNVVLMVATELANEPVLTEVYVNYADGSDSYLGTTASAPFKTIDHALSVVGDNAIIHIADGVNYLDDVDVGGLTITKNVTIIGMGNNVVIDARNSGRIFKIQADIVSLSNLIFMNANTENDSDKRGAALWVNGTTLTIDNCQFINNTAGPASSYAGAITLKASNTTIRNSLFDGNTAYYTGAAVNAEKGNLYLNVDNCVFINNQVTNVASNWANGAGICAYGTTVVNNSVFYNNSAKNGKSVYKYAGDLILSNSIILDGINSVFKYDAASQADLNGNWWGNNDTTKDLTPTNLTYTNADVESYLYLNLTMYSKGLNVSDVASVNINLFSIDGSDAHVVDLLVTLTAVNGDLNKDTLTLVNGRDGEAQYTITEVGNNTVTVDILGIKESISLTPDDILSTEVMYVDYVHGSNAYKGDSWDSAVKTLEKAVSLVDDNGIIYIANGLVYLADSTPATGIAINKNIKIIGESIDAIVSGNNAKRIFNVANGYTLTISNLTLTNGYSTAQGGAIFINNGGAINISDSVISNSRANSAGGAIGATQGYINNINNVTFINNYAGNMGGAIGISSGSASNSAITIGDNNKFINNSASNVGSAIGAGNPPVTIGKNNLFEANKGLTSNGKGTVGSNKITLGTGNVFVNNYAAQGGALFAHYNSGSATGSYCFFINNTDSSGYALRQYGNKANVFTLENCYWGTNTPDFNTIYNKAFTHNAYLVLDVSADKNDLSVGESAIITIDITKNQNNQLVDVDSLPDNVPLTFTVENGNVTPENVELIKGIASATYAPENVGNGSVTVNLYSVSETLNFTSALPDVVINTVTTPWSQGIYPAVNNTFTVKLNNNGDNAVENLILEMYSNETGELLATYTIDSLNAGSTSISLTDPTVRPLTEQTVWPDAQNNKIKFTFNLKYLDEIISTISVDKILAYDGYFNKTYAYGGHDNIINRNYTISGDIIIANNDASYYLDQYSRFRNETWSIETPEGAEIVKVLLYFAYNWDTTGYPNGWNLTFNDREIIGQTIGYETDRGNLGGWGAYDYGLVVFDVTEYYNVNGNNSFVINKTGNCALYPSTLFVLYNMSDSDHIKDVYFSDICDVFYPYYNQVGYDDLLKTIIYFNNINVDNLNDATLYAFAGSAGFNDADLSFNDLNVTNAYPSYSDKECCPYVFNVTAAISQDNVAQFITSVASSTVVAYEHVLVVDRLKNKTSISVANSSVELGLGDEFVIGAVLVPAVGDLSYSSSDESVAVVEDGRIVAVGAGSAVITVSFAGNGEYLASNATVDVTVDKAETSITVDNNTVSLVVGDEFDIGAVLVPAVGDLSYSSSDESVAVVEDGRIVAVGAGSAVITVSFAGNDDYLASNATVDVTVDKVETSISVDNASVALVVDEEFDIGAVLVPAVGDLSYSSSDESVAVVEDGRIVAVGAGSAVITVSFAGNDDYLASNATVDVTVDKSVPNIDVNVVLNNEYYPGMVTVIIKSDVDGVYNVTVGEDTIEVDVADGLGYESFVGIDAGKQNATVKFSGDEFYGETTVQKEFEILKQEVPEFIVEFGETIYPDQVNILINGPSGNYTVKVDDDHSVVIVVEEDNIGMGNISGLPSGIYTDVLVSFGGNDNVEAGDMLFSFSIKSPDSKENVSNVIEINTTVPENSTDTVFSIELPSDATGYLLVEVNGEKLFAEVVNGSASLPVPKLDPGNYTATVTYTGDNKYGSVTKSVNLTVPSNVQEDSLNIPETSETSSPVYSINLPSDATGYLEVDVDGTKYVAALNNGSASVAVPGLSEGTHNVTVTYTGDGKYSSVSKANVLNVHIPVYNITKNKNVAVIYSATKSYKVLVTKDGVAAGAGESVTFTFNGKKSTVKTDANGYATLKLTSTLKVKTYKITAVCNGVKVSNKVTIKHVVKASNKNVKKSSKVTKIKIALAKVNGKFLKGKTIKIKFNGKNYKVKTNSKGVAIWKVQKSMVQKLKVGKKLSYTVTYGKDVLTKKLIIKK